LTAAIESICIPQDSLGGNSKTIMIANIRTSAEYYQQTAVTLMYASRAKSIKNNSHVNRSAIDIGDSGIQRVARKIERLRHRLDDRSDEFDRLRNLHLRDSSEIEELKARLQQLRDANEIEKKELEAQMSHIIHSQAGQLASQRQKISSLQQSLQEELAASQNRIAEQEREINFLKK
jgi:chromosome segregation ATPase